MDDQGAGESAFSFDGTWREFAPIAFTNLLLTIVTLGIYRFWATTRERRYLWARTRFIDERLEWTGTGLELFIGFVIVVFLLFLPFLFVQFGLQALIMRGYGALAGFAVLGIYLSLLYLYGLARFRALRYRLSRTWWRGIRGGSDSQGFGYGVSAVWKTLAGGMALGLLVPWSMTNLWNERWNKMSFGSLDFSADAEYGPIFMRYLMCVGGPFILLIIAVSTMEGVMRSSGGDAQTFGLIFLAFFVLGIYILLPLAALAFYAAFFREAVGKLSLGELQFDFTASTKDWFKLVLGNIGLVIVTLGIGLIFLSYRNWSFFIRHMEGWGVVDAELLAQSSTRMSGHGEGLLDAFDVGAI